MQERCACNAGNGRREVFSAARNTEMSWLSDRF